MSYPVATKANLPRGLSNLVKFVLREHLKTQGTQEGTERVSLKKLYASIADEISIDVCKDSGIAFLTDENMHLDIQEINQRHKEKLTTVPFAPEDVAIFNTVDYPLKGDDWITRESDLQLHLADDDVSNAKCLAGMILNRALRINDPAVTKHEASVYVHGFANTRRPSEDLMPDNYQDLLQGHLIIFDKWVEPGEVGKVTVYPVMLDVNTGITTFGCAETRELGDPSIEWDHYYDDPSWDDR